MYDGGCPRRPAGGTWLVRANRVRVRVRVTIVRVRVSKG